MRFRLAVIVGSFVALSSSALAAAPGGPSKMLTDPALSAERIAFVYGNDVWTCRLDGSGVQRITFRPRREDASGLQPRRLAPRVQRRAGRQPRRLRRPGRGRRAEAPDVAPGPRRRAGLHARRQVRPLHLAARRRQQPALAALHGARRGRPRDGPSDPVRRPGGLVPRRQDDRLQPEPPGAPAVEALPRRPGLEGVARTTSRRTRSSRFRSPRRAATTRTRCGSAGRGATSSCARTATASSTSTLSIGRRTRSPSKKSAPDRITRYTDFPVLNAAAAAGRIVFEQAGTLHLFDLASRKTTDLSITVPGDLLETRPRWAKGAKWIRGAALSPSGARAAFEFRGEIVTVPAEKGDARNLTNTTAVHERAPAWSPDGKEIAYVSDESGENELVVTAQDGKGAPKKIKVPGAGFYDELVFSPDGKKIVLTDNSLTLLIVDVAKRRLEEDRDRATLRADPPADAARLVVAGLALGRLHALRPDVHPHGVRLLRRRGQVVRAHGRPFGRVRPGVRPGRQAPLLPRLHRRRPAAQLVLAAEHRRAHHERDLRRDAEEGHAFAAREGERRGEG